jgi:hypothetical protein
MLFAPKEKGQVLLGLVLILAVIAAVVIFGSGYVDSRLGKNCGGIVCP